MVKCRFLTKVIWRKNVFAAIYSLQWTLKSNAAILETLGSGPKKED